VHIGLDDGCIGPEISARSDTLGARPLDDTLVNRTRSFFAQRGKPTAEGCEVRDRVLIEASEPSVDETAPELSLQFAERPVLDVLERAAAQEPIGCDATTPRCA